MYNRQQTTENRCRKSISRLFRRRSRFHSYSMHRNRCDLRLCARRWKRPSKTEILSIWLFSGLSTKQPERGESNISNTRFERSSLPPRSSRQWRCRRKPNTANVRRSCRVKETNRAISIWHEESNQIATALDNIHQFEIPEHILNRNRRCHE